MVVKLNYLEKNQQEYMLKMIPIAENVGEITLKQSAKNSVGMFGSATSGKKINFNKCCFYRNN